MRLLGREESRNSQPSILEMIRDLKEEIARGESVYTADEIRTLERLLVDYEQVLRSLTEG